MAETSDDELLHVRIRKMASATDFQRLHNAISTNLKKITNNTTDLEGLVNKLGTPEDCEPLRDRYLHLQNETKSLALQINNDLKKLQVTTGGVEDQRKKKNLIESLSQQYLSVLNRFQAAQRTGARKEKESLDRARAVTYQQPGIHNQQQDDDAPFSNYQNQQQVVLPMERQVDLQGLQERGDQLQQIEKNIVQINELFKDVNTMIHEHGEIVDDIEKYTVDTEQKVVEANTHLVKAVDYQTAARRKKIILYTILLIVLAVIALILGIYFGTKK